MKDNLLDGYNDFPQFSSKHALIKESNLKGEKTKGDDDYVGSYTAEYENFYGGNELKSSPAVPNSRLDVRVFL